MDKQTYNPAPQFLANSIPAFWPLAAALAMGQAELELFRKNLKFVLEANKVDHGLKPSFATPNTVLLDLHTLALRDFGLPAEAANAAKAGRDGTAIPTVVVAPYAGHSAAIADYHDGQSLVQTLRAAGLARVLVTDWKSASLQMRDYDIDNYLAELTVCIDDLGGRVNLVGLCQGGWMSAMLAARFPDRIATLVLAGAPIDTHAGDGPLKKMVESSPPGFYEELVALGGGLMRGRVMLRGWKNMHPDEQYLDKYVRLYQHIDDPDYLSKTEAFSSWYENTIDLPGRWYLQAIIELFKENRLAEGRFVGLGKRLSLSSIRCPVYLLAGESDDITPKEQVFAAEKLVGTPAADIAKAMVPGGHIGLFMGSKALKTNWPQIAKWILQAQRGR
ncbi:MAG TPA: alpha/beta fold hydrolase [Burkholderiaceae bacterium]|nr:alpha/beta fold hydrolase [Burkholderiaceae bacterium]